MNFEISGKLVEVYPITVVKENFRKREFVLEHTESRNGFDYNEYIKFQLIQDKCLLPDQFKTGDILRISFSIKGRKWEKDGKVNYITNLDAWKMERVNSQPSPGMNETSEPVFRKKTEEEPLSETSEPDDLPF